MKITEQTDEQLLQQYLQSNELQYYLALFNRYQEMIFGVCHMYLNEIHQTKSQVVSIKQKLSKEIKSASQKNFRTWLYNYVRKECLTNLEEQHIPIPETLFDPLPLDEEEPLFNPTAPTESLEKLIGCLDTLPENQQLVIKLFYLKEMTMEEIEKATGIEMYKIKNLLLKGRKNLKSCILQTPLNA